MKIKPYIKNGKTYYKFVLYVGVVNGKRKYIKRANFKTKADARAAILSLQEEIDRPVGDMTFQELTEKWLKIYENEVAESTYIKTSRNIKHHITPTIGHRRISEITALELQSHTQQWCSKLKYGRKILGLVKTIYRYAVRMGFIAISPAESVAAPKLKRTISTTKDFYDKHELKEFMQRVEATGDIRKIALFRVLAFTGIRKGELRALHKDDHYSKTLRINKAVTRGFAGEEIGPTKNSSSERLISLDDKTDKILHELKRQYPTSTLLFESETGGILSPTDPRRWLLEIIEGTTLSEINIHGFRHTHASLIFDAGMTLKQVQHRLGHSDMKTTMNVYTHITQSAVDNIGEKFSEYLDF
ncbi:tyrosine-type recombinase/integrase [Streptococcus suis]|uniref:tyrosine-type recombinase/integrase n=1 Tax=Streptococcus suis TaxID=1307 RepID=UPI000429593C|nr:site-specific integrase [Streptococcus suis]HEM2799272.1 site-specific integrase [Streptococcus suis]HEM3209199.1 site-specific integrase [Streptococcus suis 22083]